MEYRRPSCLIRQCFTFPSALYTKHHAQINYYYHHTCSRPVFRIQHQNVKTLLQEMMQVAVVKAVTLKHVQVICTASSSQITTTSSIPPTSRFFTGQTACLPPNQQHESIVGITGAENKQLQKSQALKVSRWSKRLWLQELKKVKCAILLLEFRQGAHLPS